jgi:anti-anti-sigma regulatory factor
MQKLTVFDYQIRENLLILPVRELGDLWRLQPIADRALKDIIAHRVRGMIFDFPGVTAVNPSVASQLAQMINAYQALGITVVVVDLSPIIETVLDKAGLVADNVIRAADLDEGVEKAKQRISSHRED